MALQDTCRAFKNCKVSACFLAKWTLDSQIEQMDRRRHHESHEFTAKCAIMWTNLQLLGLNAAKVAKEYDAVDLSCDMFRRTNSRGMEVVLHFLFEALKGEAQTRRVSAWSRSGEFNVSSQEVS